MKPHTLAKYLARCEAGTCRHPACTTTNCILKHKRDMLSGNRPMPRRQGDGKQELYSASAAIDTGTDTPVRQEFKDETDVNVILSRYGIAGLTQAALRPTYSQADYDTDLQQAMHAIADAKDAFGKLPPELKEKYPTWQELLTALEAGDHIDFTLKKPEPPKSREEWEAREADEAAKIATQPTPTPP